MAVQGKSVHLEADYRNLARILPSLSLPKDAGPKQGCYGRTMRRQPQRSDAQTSPSRGAAFIRAFSHQPEAGLRHAVSGSWGESASQHEP